MKLRGLVPIGVVVLLVGFAQPGYSTHPEVIERVKSSVAKVTMTLWEDDPISGTHVYPMSGSGVIVAVDRGRAYILTNRHVADAAWYMDPGRWGEVDPLETGPPEFRQEQTVVSFADGYTTRAVLHWRSPCADLAVLEAYYPGNAVRSAELEPQVRTGEEVFALGHPLGLDYTLTKGIVSAHRQIMERGCVYEAVQTDASINPGNSGGGLFNSAGRLVGINTLKLTVGEGIGFAVSVTHYLREIGRDPRQFAHGHEEPVAGQIPVPTPQTPADGQRAYFWVGRFEVTIELANGEKRSFETTDAMGLYSEQDFEFAKQMEVESRKEIIKQFLLRRYGKDISRVVSVELKGVEKHEYRGK